VYWGTKGYSLAAHGANPRRSKAKDYDAKSLAYQARQRGEQRWIFVCFNKEQTFKANMKWL
jgi:hypothetical protein